MGRRHLHKAFITGSQHTCLPEPLPPGHQAGPCGRSYQGSHPNTGLSATCCCSVARLCPALCDPVGCSTPGFPVLHCLPDSSQTHVIELVMPPTHLIFCRQCQPLKDIPFCRSPAPTPPGAGDKVWPLNASSIALDS